MAEAPTLLATLGPDMQLATAGGFATPHELVSSTQWAGDMVQAFQLAENPRNRDKATSQLTRTLAQYAMDQQNIVFEPRRLKLYQRVYNDLNLSAKKAFEAGTLAVEPEFARAVYLEIVPQLLRINNVSDTFNNGSGNNSVEQIVSTAMTFMHAQQVRDAGGTFTIFQQMCAHYDSGEAHDASSFARGLLPQLNEEKLASALGPVSAVAAVLRRFDIPVTISHAQVIPEGELLLAMVPATVWSYLEKEGGAAEMLHILRGQYHHFTEMSRRILGRQHADNHTVVGYNEIVSAEGATLTEEVTQLCGHFGVLYATYAESRKLEGKDWTRLETQDISELLRFIDYEFKPGSFFDDVATQQDWTRENKEMMQLMIQTLGFPDWGTLDDTEKFYGRESQRRAVLSAENSRRTMNRNAETQALLASPSFHPDLSPNAREAKAHDLLQWVDVIANIGIGARAVYNTALYATLGKHMVRLNSGPHKGVMWPMEEDVDRWALHAMQAVWQTFRQRHVSHLPHVMPEKALRQPFC